MEKVTVSTSSNPSSQTCELVNFNGQLVAFCKTTDFKTSVKDAIDDKLFWRDLFERYSVVSTVHNELNSKVPPMVKSETNKIIKELTRDQTKLVNDQLENYTKFQIPSHVAKALTDQITSFLNNNVQMNQILSQHSVSLNQQLYNSASDTLTKVANEDQYHQVTNLHISAANLRFNEALIKQNSDANNQFAAQDKTFSNKVNEMQKQVNSEIQTLTTANEKIRDQQSKLDKQQDKIEILEKHVSSVSTTLNFVALGCIAAFSFAFYLIKH